MRKLRSLRSIDNLAANSFFKLELDIFITEDDVFSLSKTRSEMPDYSLGESRAFLKAVPDPTSALFFFVVPVSSSKLKPRRTIESDSRSQIRNSNALINSAKQTSISMSLRFDSTMHTLKPQSPPPKKSSRNIKKVANPDHNTSNSKMQAQMRSTISKINDTSASKQRFSFEKVTVKGLASSLDPDRNKQGFNLYQNKSRICRLISNYQN